MRGRVDVEEGAVVRDERLARRVSREGVEPVEAPVPAEEPLAIEINGRTVAVLMRTPGDEKALALGYCLSEGLLRSLDEVLLLHHCGTGEEELPGAEVPLAGRNRVRLLVTTEAEAALPEAPARWVFSGCAGVDVAALGADLAVGREDLRVPPEVLWEMVPAIVRAQEAYRATGGIHAAALADETGALVALAEDVGRHNAVDKVIGAAALARRSGAILIATGRASSDIVAKAARAHIPVVASFSSSTSLAVRLAEAAGITLAGYLRRNRFTVYTHAERIAAG